MRFASVAVSFLMLSSAAISEPLAKTDELTRLTRQVGYRFGKCVVSHHVGGASKAVLRNVDLGTLNTHFIALFDGSCFASNVGLTFADDSFLYVLADALVMRILANAPVPNLANVQPLSHRQPQTPPLAPPVNAKEADQIRYQLTLKSIDRSRGSYLLSVYGECVVRANAAGANRLLMAEPESVAEATAFNALQPTLEACMPEAKTVTLTKTALRGTIALNYYRLAQAVLHAPVR